MFDEIMDPISETIDKSVEANHDAVTLMSAGGTPIPGTSAFCVVYVSGRPVLQWVRAVLFFKPKWRAVVSVMIAGLDALCAGTENAGAIQTPMLEAGAAYTGGATEQVSTLGDPPSHNGAAIDKKDESLQGE